jgi:hypothetical protein
MGTFNVRLKLSVFYKTSRKFFAFLFLVFTFKILVAEEYEATGAGETVDSEFFGGLSKEELEKLKKMKGAYSKSVQENFQKFIDGGKQTSDGGGGRYSSFGENHLGVNGISEHSLNGAEKINIKSALGSDNLSPSDILKKNKEIMDSYCVKIETGKDAGKCRNKFTGKVQEINYNISAAIYDAGPAHGSEADDKHRVYGVIESVRDDNKKFGTEYGKRIVQDAKQPGVNTNLEMLEIARLQLEQQKYVHTAAMSFALKAARLSGHPKAANEFKQLALNLYAKNKGNIKEAEKQIKKELAQRIAQDKALGFSGFCSDGSIKNTGEPCPATPPNTNSSEMSMSDLAKAVLKKRGVANPAPEKLAVLEDVLTRTFKIYKNPKPPAPLKATLEEAYDKLIVSSFSGVLDDDDMKSLYSSLKIDDDKKKQINEYVSNLEKNKCLDFEKFCYSSSVNDAKDSKGNVSYAGLVLDKDKRPVEFQVINGDPGNYFHDTRELTYSNFAYAANRPLSEAEGHVTNADFSSETDAKLTRGYNRNKDDLKPYEEFQKNYKEAMAAAKDIHENYDDEVIKAYIKAGATKADIDSLKANYKTDKFDPNKRTFFELFGGMQKGRDAVLSSWRTNPNGVVDPNQKKPTPLLKARTPSSKSQLNTQNARQVP